MFNRYLVIYLIFVNNILCLTVIHYTKKKTSQGLGLHDEYVPIGRLVATKNWFAR